MQKIEVKNKKEMADLARKIAASSQKNDIILLYGNLGAGKTFFAQNFINSLSDKEQNVLSPTFNIVNSYQTKKGEVFHFDLYRIKSVEELENIGFFDAIKSGICLIEWAEIAESFLGKNCVKIKIISDAKSEVRVVEIS